MPQIVTIRVRSRRGRRIRLWIPLLPVFLVLSPLLLLAGLVLVVASVAYRANPGRALSAGWRLLAALRGVRLEIEQGSATVLVNIT